MLVARPIILGVSLSLGLTHVIYALALSFKITHNKYHHWSDSQIVLHWIYSGKKLKQFVAHRIQEIHSPTLILPGLHPMVRARAAAISYNTKD